MNLLRCHILNFGKLSDLKLSFTPGLNIVFAPNEGGKSTLQRFLVGMLYGPVRPDVKTQRRFDPWVDQYKPWRGSDYGGTIFVALAGGRQLEIYRTFDREDGRLEIRTSTGEDITRQYEVQRNSDVLFAASHLGLTKELFESAGVIRETETASISHPEPLRDRIANLAQSGDEKLSVRLSLAKLDDALEAVGSERAPTKPYRRALDRMEELQQERGALEARRHQNKQWLAERLESAQQIEFLDRNLAASRNGVIDARWRHTSLLVRTLEELQADIRNLNSEMDTLGADPDFPVQCLEGLNRLEADHGNAEARLQELHRRMQDALATHGQVEAEIKALAGYAELHAAIEPEKITEWFVGYLSLNRQRDDLQRTLNRQMEISARLQDSLDSLSPALRDLQIDWERKVRQISEQERTASDQGLATAETLARDKAEHARLLARGKRCAWMSTASLLGAIGSAALGFAGWAPIVAAVAGGAVFAILAIIAFISASRTRSAAAETARSFESLESNLSRLRDQAQAAQNELTQAVTSSGFTTVEEFLAATKQAAADRQRLGDLVHHIHEAELQRNQVQLESDGLYSHLKECLAKVGLSCSPANVKAQVDSLRARMRRYAELLGALRVRTLEIKNLQSDTEEVAERAGRILSSIQEILSAGKASSVDGFRQAAQNCRRFLELRAKSTARSRELERLRGDWSVSQWQERLRELDSSRAARAVSAGTGSSPSSCLPYQPSVEEAEQEEKEIAAALASSREEFARLVEKVRQAFHSYRSPAEIEEDLAGAEREVQELSANRQALTIAADAIRNLARLQQEVCAPQLNRTVEERFLRICPERYEEVKIDPEFRVQVRAKDAAELRNSEFLSRGTQDQLYLAMRFGVLDLLGDPQETCPCLLDEPFVAYDRERMTATFPILGQEATRRQLILFTCRDEVRDLALLHGAHMVWQK